MKLEAVKDHAVTPPILPSTGSMNTGRIKIKSPHQTYTIGQLCREFKVSSRTLRFYEERSLLFPTRYGTQRVYSQKERARLALIVRGKAVYLSLNEIARLLDAYENRGEADQFVQAQSIFRDRLAQLEVERLKIDRAIEALRAACDRMTPSTSPLLRESD